MRILATANAAWNVAHFRAPVLQSLLGDGHEVVVCAPPDASVSRLEAMGCRCLPLPMNPKGLNPLEELRLVRRFARIFATERPDVVLSYTIKNNIFAALAARPLDIPLIPNVTGLGTAFIAGGLLQGVVELLYRRAFRDLPTVFFQNQDDRALFETRGLVRPHRAKLLPGSGVDLTHFTPAPLPDGPPVFLMIARLLRDKGVVEFADAARLVKARHPDARFQLLGALGTDNRTAINANIVREWAEQGVIEYLGTADDVRPAIAAAHCVVLPSYREGAPRTLIEAAAMGRPLIATDVPGCTSVVEAGVNGLVCEARSGDSLADAMRRFLALPGEVRRALGDAGRAKMVHEFDQSLVVAAYRAAIEHATGRWLRGAELVHQQPTAGVNDLTVRRGDGREAIGPRHKTCEARHERQ